MSAMTPKTAELLYLFSLSVHLKIYPLQYCVNLTTVFVHEFIIQI